VTTLFGIAESTELQAVPEATPKKRGWLPLLTVLFMISYGLMTMLIVEQGQTIEQQRALIRELFRDSTELSAVKLKAQQEAHAALTQNPSSQTQSQTPSSQSQTRQAPSSQSQTRQAPSSQAGHVQNQAKSKTRFEMPSRPASDLQDARRALIML
jgi:predicted lipid-binding transport protein (Tim44 family)